MKIAIDRSLVEQALEALTPWMDSDHTVQHAAYHALRAALAQQAEQAEPVAAERERCAEYLMQQAAECRENSPTRVTLESCAAVLRLGLVEWLTQQAEPVLQTCNCRWDGEVQVQQCTLHEAHIDAIHEWAGRAKVAERKLAQQADTAAWLRVIDEELVGYHIGTAEPSDDYKTAKQKMNNLLNTVQDVGVYFAKHDVNPIHDTGSWIGDPSVQDYASTQPEPIALKQCLVIEHRHGVLYMNGTVIDPGNIELRSDGYTYRSSVLPQQTLPVKPVAWWYKDEPWFDGKRWHDNYSVTKEERVAKRTDPHARPLYFNPTKSNEV